jgi:uncharacterized protein YicC (UPF0701 family)
MRRAASTAERRAGPERGIAPARSAARRGSQQTTDLSALAASVLEQTVPLLEQLKAMRAREGEALEAILRGTLDRLAAQPRASRSCARRSSSATRSGWRNGWPRPWGRSSTSKECLRKLLCLVERSDISEELARMTTHIEHFRELLSTGGEAGKKLDFLLQEMNREANTLLSKTGRREREGNAHHRAGAGHEIGDRKGTRADSERGVKQGECESVLTQKPDSH